VPAPELFVWLLDKDHPCLKGVVLSMVRGIQLKIPMLVFGNDLKPVLQWDIHVWRKSPLGVEQR
jgi:hypothetical protein